jgi:uncharacterized membrane protein
MKYLVFLILSILTGCLVASLIGWAVAVGSLLIPIFTIPLGIIVILASRQHVDEILIDDRTQEIHSRAALRTLEIGIILGIIAAVILYSYVISEPLSPKITGTYKTDDKGVRSMEITVYQPGFIGSPDPVIRTTTIPDVDRMNEFEAMEYSQFRRESFQDNERKGLVGLTLAFGVISLLIIFGVFYLYYTRKY